MNHKPSVVIVDPDPERRAEVHRTAALANLTVLAEGGLGVEGHTLVSESRPDCVLLCLDAPVERGLQTLEAIAASQPDLPLLVYSTIDDGASVRRAMLAGADDYLSMPLSNRGLGEAVHAALDRISQRGSASAAAAAGSTPPISSAAAGMIITVFGPKGGIGKTTIATNLAIALANTASASVALVDADTRFGDVAIMLDVAPENNVIAAARDSERLDRGTIRRYLTQHPSGVSVLPAPTSPGDWEAVTPEQLERVVHLLAQTHDYVVVDTPGAFSEVVAMSLDVANVVLLVTSLDMPSIKDTSLVLNMLRSWSFPEGKVRLTVNHANHANSVNEDDISRTLDYQVFWSIPYDEYLPKAVQLGQPIVQWRPDSRAGVNLTHLAGLLSGAPVPAQDSRKGGVLSRLLKRGDH